MFLFHLSFLPLPLVLTSKDSSDPIKNFIFFRK